MKILLDLGLKRKLYVWFEASPHRSVGTAELIRRWNTREIHRLVKLMYTQSMHHRRLAVR